MAQTAFATMALASLVAGAAGFICFKKGSTTQWVYESFSFQKWGPDPNPKNDKVPNGAELASCKVHGNNLVKKLSAKFSEPIGTQVYAEYGCTHGHRGKAEDGSCFYKSMEQHNATLCFCKKERCNTYKSFHDTFMWPGDKALGDYSVGIRTPHAAFGGRVFAVALFAIVLSHLMWSSACWD